jgi:hypothetical protein
MHLSVCLTIFDIGLGFSYISCPLLTNIDAESQTQTMTITVLSIVMVYRDDIGLSTPVSVAVTIDHRTVSVGGESETV